MVGSITSATLHGAKQVGKFLWYGQEWGQFVGNAYKTEKLANPSKTSLFSFSWKKSYGDFFEKQASEAAKKASTAGLKGFLSKIGGKIMPALILVTTGMAVVNAVKEGGIIEGGKELVRGAAGYTGAALTALMAGIMFTNPVGLIGGLALSIAGFTMGEWAAKKIVGAPIAELKGEIAPKQEELAEKQTIDMANIDRRMSAMKNMFDSRNYRNNPEESGLVWSKSFIA